MDNILFLDIDGVLNTCEFRDIFGREQEILSWVKVPKDGIVVKNWVAVDDMDLQLPKDNFVQTNFDEGLIEYKAQQIINKFKG